MRLQPLDLQVTQSKIVCTLSADLLNGIAQPQHLLSYRLSGVLGRSDVACQCMLPTVGQGQLTLEVATS